MISVIGTRKGKALSVPNTINSFIRVSFWQNQCPLTATFACVEVFVREVKGIKAERTIEY